MDDKLYKIINEYIERLEHMKAGLTYRADELKERNRLILRVRETDYGKYYCVKDPGSCGSTYLGNESNKEVGLIKEAHFVDQSLGIINEDIAAAKTFLDIARPTDYESVNAILPKVYRDAELSFAAMNKDAAVWKEEKLRFKTGFSPWHPEELVHQTKEGYMVRSKSERLIARTLFDYNATYIYELPRKISGAWRLPDFTILSELDYMTEIIIEHQGMMDIDNYVERFVQKLKEYLRAGYVPNVNVFFTFDDLKGNVDTTVIEGILRENVRAAA